MQAMKRQPGDAQGKGDPGQANCPARRPPAGARLPSKAAVAVTLEFVEEQSVAQVHDSTNFVQWRTPKQAAGFVAIV